MLCLLVFVYSSKFTGANTNTSDEDECGSTNLCGRQGIFDSEDDSFEPLKFATYEGTVPVVCF